MTCPSIRGRITQPRVNKTAYQYWLSICATVSSEVHGITGQLMTHTHTLCSVTRQLVKQKCHGNIVLARCERETLIQSMCIVVCNLSSIPPIASKIEENMFTRIIHKAWSRICIYACEYIKYDMYDIEYGHPPKYKASIQPRYIYITFICDDVTKAWTNTFP